MILLHFTFQNYSALSLLQDSDQWTKFCNSTMVQTENKGIVLLWFLLQHCETNFH